MSRKKHKQRSKKGRLILDGLDDIPRKFFKKSKLKRLKKILRDILKDHPGIYALYKNKKLKYVGLSDDLYRRSRGRSYYDESSWDNIKIIPFRNKNHIKDAETFFLKIYKPPWNDAVGKFKKEGELEKFIIDSLKEHNNRLKEEKLIEEKQIKKHKKRLRKSRKKIMQIEKTIEKQKMLRDIFKHRS